MQDPSPPRALPPGVLRASSILEHETAHHPLSLKLLELGLVVLMEEEVPEEELVEGLVEGLVELWQIQMTQVDKNEMVPRVVTVELEFVRCAASQ